MNLSELEGKWVIRTQDAANGDTSCTTTPVFVNTVETTYVQVKRINGTITIFDSKDDTTKYLLDDNWIEAEDPTK